MLMADGFCSDSGAVGSITLAYTLPCIFHLQMCWSELSVPVKVKDVVIIVTGLSFTILSLFTTVQDLVTRNWPDLHETMSKDSMQCANIASISVVVKQWWKWNVYAKTELSFAIYVWSWNALLQSLRSSVDGKPIQSTETVRSKLMRTLNSSYGKHVHLRKFMLNTYKPWACLQTYIKNLFCLGYTRESDPSITQWWWDWKQSYIF